MAQPERIESLDDVKAWINHRDGRDDAWWAAQHGWNGKVEKDMRTLERRVSVVERKMAAVAAIASTVGGFLGAIIARMVMN